MAILTFPSGGHTDSLSLTTEQVANVALEIATYLSSIDRLVVMMGDCSNMADRGALGHGIECLSKRAGAMADFLGKAHDGVPVRGDFNAWFTPECAPLPGAE